MSYETKLMRNAPEKLSCGSIVNQVKFNVVILINCIIAF